MADFNSAVGHNQFPNGNWSPELFSKLSQDYFKTINVVDEITNTQYEGEIVDKGTSVRILKAPVPTVRTLARGTKLETQYLDDDQVTLTIDQALYYQFVED